MRFYYITYSANGIYMACSAEELTHNLKEDEEKTPRQT